ncbi:hypothetical protein D9757_003089 [Collybiopsis confluens]|uniref:Uncharacterized protein n=1 Tax=Collybiopsis confluens TaxID=2823264 RepID=A0A8H5HXA3_9AGAR|nr:hypothetical protein D9757_003089 [Collybiopsis confluens]
MYNATRRNLVLLMLLSSALELCTSAVAFPVDADTDETSILLSAPAILAPQSGKIPLRSALTGRKFAITIAEDTPSINGTEDEDNLTDINASPPRLSRVSIILAVSAVGACLLLIYILIHHPPTHLIDTHVRPSMTRLFCILPASVVHILRRTGDIYHRLASHLHLPATTSALPALGIPRTKPSVKSPRQRGTGSSFRGVGEGQLVKWAQEDMAMLDTSDMEADLMVNAEDSADADDLVDECIPLSIGMGWKARAGRTTRGSTLPMRNYGSGW